METKKTGKVLVICSLAFTLVLGAELIGASGSTLFAVGMHQKHAAEGMVVEAHREHEADPTAVPAEAVQAVEAEAEGLKSQAGWKVLVGELMLVFSKWAVMAILVGTRLVRWYKPVRLVPARKRN